MQFYLLRVQSEIVPNVKPETVAVKFFHIRSAVHPFAGVLLDAETQEEAFAKAKKELPFHHCNLAIQEKTSYDRTIRELKSLPKGRTFPIREDASVGN